MSNTGGVVLAPSRAKPTVLNFTSTWASAGKTTGKRRGLRNLVLRRGTWPAAGRWLFLSWLLRTACQTDALARTEPQSHAAGTGPIAIEHVKNNAPQHAWAFPISPAALLPAALAPASPRCFCRPRSSASSFPPAVPARGPPGASPGALPPSPFAPPRRCPAAAIPGPAGRPWPALPAQPLAVLGRLLADLCFPPLPAHPRPAPCSSLPASPLPPRSAERQIYREIYIYIYTHTCARLSQFLCAACTGPEFKRARRIKGPATWHLNRTARQMDGTSCGSFPWGTSVTCENCGHRAVPEKDVSSPTFNSGISRANGIKHALKAFEGTIFQLLFSMPDDSVVQSISPGDAVNRESHGRKRSFPSSMLGKQKAG